MTHRPVMGHGSLLIIVNPTSGRGRALELANALGALLQSRGQPVVIRETTRSRDAERLTREACICKVGRPDCVIACGGDGTVQQVVNGLVQNKSERQGYVPLLGIAPAGRCNDFARALEIKSDPAAVADTIEYGRPEAVDLGRLNGRYFCTVATLGVDAEVTSFVDAMRMPLRGTAAYVYGALRVLARYRSSRVRLEGDFGVIEKAVFLASSANTSTYGGAIPIAPGASPHDGELDLCIIDRVSRPRAFAMLPIVMMGRHCSLDAVRFIRTRQFTVSASKAIATAPVGAGEQQAGGRDQPSQELEIWADGELMGTTPATVCVAPGAVSVLMMER